MHCASGASSSRTPGIRLRSLSLVSLVLACVMLPASSHAREKVAVVISQAVGVGPLADHLGNLAAEQLSQGVVRVIGPGDATRLARQKGAPTPESCGSDVACLRALARALEARWVVAIGIGSFGEIFSLELRCVEQDEEAQPAVTSATYAAPGPDWSQALRERLALVVPKRLLHSRGDLLIQSSEVGAEIRINDLAAGTIPLAAPLRLPEGRYTVELRRDGHASAQQVVEIQAGETTEIQLELAPIGGESRPLRTYAYASSGAAVAALGTAIILHLGANSAMDEARALQRQGKAFADERASAKSTMTTSRIFYGVAGAAAIGSAILFYLDHQQARR